MNLDGILQRSCTIMAPFISTDAVTGLESEVCGGGDDGDESSHESSDGTGSSSEQDEDEDDNDLSAIVNLGPLLLMKLARGSQSIAETQEVVDHTGRVEINIGNGLTLLHVAASNNRVDLVEFLCSRGHSTEVICSSVGAYGFMCVFLNYRYHVHRSRLHMERHLWIKQRGEERKMLLYSLSSKPST